MLLTRLGVPKLWNEDLNELWRIMRLVVAPVVQWLAPSYAYGVERVPPTGGAIMAANHLAAIDHALIGNFCPRPIVYMSKRELMELPLVGEILAWTRSFPVRRGEADREALRRAREVVREGWLLGVHLEGTRQRFGHPGEMKPGGLMIAMQEGVPVVPCGVESFGWSLENRRPCCLVWGEAISLEGFSRSGRGYREATEYVGAELVRLWRQAAEAVAAGFPPELPDGAKRHGPIPPNYEPPRRDADAREEPRAAAAG